ncbi:MAG: hypothetical protein IJM09_05120, partial [Neisseriaceae bacterium]|nr:hypothetical protein [Neisseriaceae bacterium]
SLSLGDWAFRNFTSAGRAETRAFNEYEKQLQELNQKKFAAENALSGDYKNMRSSLQNLGDEIQKQSEQFNNATISMQLAEKQLKLDEIESSGKDSLDDIIKLENELKELELKNQANINKQGESYIQSLIEQSNQIGKNNDELEIMRLATSGVSNHLIEQAKLYQQHNEQLRNQEKLQDKINALLEENERFGKSERELFQLDVAKLAGGNENLIKQAMDAFDKNSQLKLFAEMQKESSETFSSAVNKFAESNSDNPLSDFEKQWQTYWANLDNMSYLEQRAFFKQEQLNLPSYSSVTAEQFDKAASRAADELTRFYKEIESNHNALREMSSVHVAGVQGLDYSGSLPELDTNTTALNGNTMALDKMTQTLQTQATAAVSTPATSSVADFGGANLGTLNLVISSDNEKLAGKITGTKEFLQAFSRLFSSYIGDLAVAHA